VTDRHPFKFSPAESCM